MLLTVMLWLTLVLVPLAQAAWCPLDCRCDKFPNGEIEITCPQSEPIARLIIYARANKEVRIQCTSETTSNDFSKLDGLVLEDAPVLSISQCPLPETSLKNLTTPFGLKSIEKLIFQSIRNLSNTMDSDFLKDLTNLTHLALQGNGLTSVPVDLLKDLSQLRTLNFMNNFLIIPSGFFNHAPNLTWLELGNNNISYLDPDTFNGLKKLKLLNLWNNQLEKLDGNLFSNLGQLQSLDLHSNRLTNLENDIFKSLANLTVLNLFGNNFTYLPSGLFSSTPKLEELRLHSNRRNLTLPDDLLNGLVKLKNVNLMDNGLESIPERLFFNSSNIENILLNGNFLKEIPGGLFVHQVKLQVLDLSNNRLESLPDGVFKMLGNLKSLRLDRNRFVKISGKTLQGLENLSELRLDRNEITQINAAAFQDLINLRKISLSKNKLTSIEFSNVFGYSPLHYCTKLESVNLSNNSLTEIAEDWRILHIYLQNLDLSFNNLSTIQILDLKFGAKNLKINLNNNQITTIGFKNIALLSLLSETDSTNLNVDLSSNPLICDCHAYELSQYANNGLEPHIYNSLKLEMNNLFCESPSNFKNRPFTKISSMELTCDVKMNCPENCNCAYRSADKALIVNCSGRGINKIPLKMPKHIKANHTELLLENNQLLFLPETKPSGYDNITHLFLSKNKISRIPFGYLNSNLQILTINHNNFSRLDDKIIEFLNNASELRMIMLHDNPWICDCDALKFKSLLHNLTLDKKLSFSRNISCNDGRAIITETEFCPPALPLGILMFCISSAVIGILIGIIAALYYRYHYAIRVWMYAHRCCLWLITEEELDRDKKYDAFVSFSQKDEQFVVEQLVPRLEAAGSTLCLHYRDWLAGEWITTQIAQSVESSRRTIIILSRNFLDSVWGRLEFKAAHKQALSDGRARVIMILYGDLPPLDQLDAELRAYISVNTYVKWGDPWFWEKLRYALPHAQFKNNKISDKLELIRAVSTNNSVPTTPPVLSIPQNVIMGKDYETSVAC